MDTLKSKRLHFLILFISFTTLTFGTPSLARSVLFITDQNQQVTYGNNKLASAMEVALNWLGLKLVRINLAKEKPAKHHLADAIGFVAWLPLKKFEGKNLYLNFLSQQLTQGKKGIFIIPFEEGAPDAINPILAHLNVQVG